MSHVTSYFVTSYCYFISHSLVVGNALSPFSRFFFFHCACPVVSYQFLCDLGGVTFNSETARSTPLNDSPGPRTMIKRRRFPGLRKVC